MPTKDEQINFLRTELAKAQNAARKAQNAARKAQQRADSQARKVTSLEKENTRLGGLVEELKASIKAKDCSLIAVLAVLEKTVKYLDDMPDIPEAQQDRLKWLVQQANFDAGEIFSSGYDRLLRDLFARGGEKINGLFKLDGKSVEEKQKEVVDEINSRNAGYQQQKKDADNLFDVMDQAAAQAAQEHPEDPLVQAVAEVAAAERPTKRVKPPKVELKDGKKTRGRVVTEAQKNAKVKFGHPFNAQCKCPKCGSLRLKEHVQDLMPFLRSLRHCLDELIGEDRYKVPIVHCPDCGCVFADRPEHVPVPYSPTSSCTTSSNVVIEMGVLAATGTPNHRVEGFFDTDRLQICKEGFNRSIHAWLGKTGIGGLLLGQIVKQARKAENIVCDETPFRVLERDSDPGSPHLIARTSVLGDDMQFAIFEYMPSRSGACIAEKLWDWEYVTLTRDAYEGYEAAARHELLKNRTVRTQCCLVHFRRTLLRALNIKDLKEEVMSEGALERIVAQVVDHTPRHFLTYALETISKVYSWEAECARRSGETRAEQLERIKEVRAKHCRPLMLKLKQMIDAIAGKYAVQENGVWTSKLAGSATAAVVTYWKNHEDKLMYFLEDPHVSPDSNIVERMMRAVALYKNGAFYKKSVEGAKAYCGMISLRQTARLNGIRNVTRWLLRYHRAFYEHIERYVWTSNYAGKAEDKELVTAIQKIPQTAIDSFDFTPWLPWNYVKTLPADERLDQEESRLA